MPDPRLAPIWAMFEWLELGEQQLIARAMNQRLHKPATFAQRRAEELGFLAKLLDEVPQQPDTLPYVERQVYDGRRPTEAPDAPTSRVLAARFGGWRRACAVAWGVLPDGSNRFARYLAPPVPLRPRGGTYTREEAERSVRQCAQELGRTPISGEYHYWMLERTRRAREQGRPIRLAPYRAVLKHLAPDRGRRDGWRLVVERVFSTAGGDATS